MDISSVAAIILNYNGFEDTVECIESIKKYYDGKLKIYLIDNASPDGSGEKLKKYFPGIDIFLLDENRGYAAGNNFGIKQAYKDGYEYFLILNNDIVLKEEILRTLLKEFRNDERIGVVTCKVLYKNKPNIINAAGGDFNPFICAGKIHRISQRDKHINEKKYISFVPGSVFLLKKAVIDVVGYMNEKFFMYSEDVEYSLRVCKHFKMYYTSDVSVLHGSGGGVIGKSYSSTYLFYHTRNKIWLARTTVSTLYFMYIIIFIFLNCLVKTLIVILEPFRCECKFKNVFKKLKNLWVGFFNGLITSIDKS